MIEGHYKILTTLSIEEATVLQELSKKLQIPEERIMIQALRIFQLVQSGGFNLVEVNPLRKYIEQ